MLLYNTNYILKKQEKIIEESVISMCLKRLCGSIDITDEERLNQDCIKKVQLEYYVVEEDVEEDLPDLKGKCYGIEIVKKELTSNDDTYMENNLIKDIMFCEKRMVEFVNSLILHKVTPITLNNIVEDFLAAV